MTGVGMRMHLIAATLLKTRGSAGPGGVGGRARVAKLFLARWFSDQDADGDEQGVQRRFTRLRIGGHFTATSAAQAGGAGLRVAVV